MKLHRIIIYPKDICRITGKSARQVRRIICVIRAKFGKDKHHAITVHEFCEYMGIPLEVVRPFLQ